VSAKPKTIRLPDGLVERLEALARVLGVDFSTAARLAMQRGVAIMEQEQKPAPVAPAPRRRVFSRGVGP
jgi:predicted transcriptional regulator